MRKGSLSSAMYLRINVLNLFKFISVGTKARTHSQLKLRLWSRRLAFRAVRLELFVTFCLIFEGRTNVCFILQFILVISISKYFYNLSLLGSFFVVSTFFVVMWTKNIFLVLPFLLQNKINVCVCVCVRERLVCLHYFYCELLYLVAKKVTFI